jgi:hypothetical protein
MHRPFWGDDDGSNFGGIMTKDGRDHRDEPGETGRRNFLAVTGRNILAIGGIVASAVAARVKPASASPVCFLAGTRIRTADGDRKVEQLAVGDLLPTVFGGLRPIQWIGSYRYKRSDRRKPWVSAVRPIRVATSALAPNVPHRDLYLTQFHALYIDGALVPVGSLVNGTTIARCPADEVDELAYFHIKLASHDVIDADGAACESLLIVDETASNFADYFRRYGMPMTPDRPCAPVLSYTGGRSETASRLRSALAPWLDRRRKLDRIRDRLADRADALRARETARL